MASRGVVFVGVVACVLLPSVTVADLAVLDFESLRVEDDQIHELGETYSEDGFTLTAYLLPEHGGTPGFYSAGTQSPWFFGSTGIWNLNSSGGNVLTAGTGGLAPGANPGPFPPFDITFFGSRADSSLVSQTVLVTNSLTFETYTFSGFTDLTSVNWFQGTGNDGNRAHQFDNVTIQTTAVIPAPGAVLLGALGLGMVGCVKRWHIFRPGR